MTSRVERMLDEARAVLPRRVLAGEIAGLLADGALVVDIRPVWQRQRDGELPGATVIERNHLEWRLDPTSAHRLDDRLDDQRVVVVVCDEGYASSLAAASLQQLGLARATDLDGGYRSWRRSIADG